MSLRTMLKPAIQSLIRRGSPVAFGDVTGKPPISRSFGWERGQPIDRAYIARFLEAESDAIRGQALEIAEIRYLGEKRNGVTERIVLAADARAVTPAGADGVIIADLCDLATLPKARFDCFICTQTLNFIYDTPAAVAGAYALLKPGGTFLGTVAGISQISRYDADRWGDFWRFTPQSLQRLLTEAFGDNVRVESFGNLSAAIALLQGLAIEDLRDPGFLAVSDPDYPVLLGFRATKI